MSRSPRVPPPQLLKSEVRRLERNHEREKSVANLEYLKNVLLQFIFLHSGSERQALLPVIHTMLQLSPEEKSKLAAIAQGRTTSLHTHTLRSLTSGYTRDIRPLCRNTIVTAIGIESISICLQIYQCKSTCMCSMSVYLCVCFLSVQCM